MGWRLLGGALPAVIAFALLTEAPAGTGDETGEVADGIDVYFRESDVTAVAEQDLAEYRSAEPGEAERFERSFDSAPPQIPHSVEDLLPILADENQCLDCHLPENAEDAEAVPIPVSHFRRPVILGPPRESEPDPDLAGGMRVVVDGFEVSTELTGARHNCVQCHTPQAENVREPVNLFDSHEAR
jgi:cytochrome c-type protein NapB